MNYTHHDLTQIKSAILKLSLGEKVVSFSRTSAVGSQTVTFNQTQIADLERLRDQIERELSGGKNSYILVKSSKGL